MRKRKRVCGGVLMSEKIEEARVIAKGVGGSYTRWQRKPPAHIEIMFELADGRTYRGNFHYDKEDDELKLAGVIDQIGSDVEFEDLDEELKEKILAKAENLAYESGFWDVSKTKQGRQKQKLKEVT